MHELVGAVVAAVVVAMRLMSHVQGLAIVHRGDHVPGGAAVRHQIDGLELPRHVEGLVIRGGAGGAQAQPFSRHTHGHEHRNRIHLDAADAVFDRVGVIAAQAIRHGQSVVEKTHVEFARFEDAADVAVVVRGIAVGARRRMAPGTHQVGAVLSL
jgi:hypothetical protein